MPTMYAVFNTQTNEFYGHPMSDKQPVKNTAAWLNQALKPEFQHYTVVTVIFDPEV